MGKKKIRRFVVTVEEVDPLAIEHQEPEPLQTRQPAGPERLPDESWDDWTKRRAAAQRKESRNGIRA